MVVAVKHALTIPNALIQINLDLDVRSKPDIETLGPHLEIFNIVAVRRITV